MIDVALQTALWNGLVATLLGLLALGVSRIWRNPALLHLLWVLVLLKLLVPPFLTIPIPLPTDLKVFDTPSSDDALAPSTGSTEMSTSRPDGEGGPARQGILPATFDWQSVLLIFWIVGSASVFLILLIRTHRFRRYLALAHQPSTHLHQEVRRLAELMRLKKCPEICIVPARVSPMIWVLGKTRLIIPKALLDNLDSEARTTLLAHELAHIKRRDYWIRFLEAAATTFYWWHPVLWWARREIGRNEELCCDQFVVDLLPDSRNTYAEVLVDTVAFLSGVGVAQPGIATGIDCKGSLERRLIMIMRGTARRNVSLSGQAVLITLSVLLFLLPTWAHTSVQPPLPASQGQENPQEQDDFNIEKQIERRVEGAIDEQALEKKIEDALARAEIERKTEAAFGQTEHLNVPVLVGEVLREVNISKLIKDTLEGIDINQIVRNALQQVDLDQLIRTAMTQVHEEISRAEQQGEKQLPEIGDDLQKTEPSGKQ